MVPAEKKTMIANAVENVDEIKANYNMGLITDTERYNGNRRLDKYQCEAY